MNNAATTEVTMDDTATTNASEATALLSCKRAKEFVAETLEVDRFDEKFKSDKLLVLNEIIFAWQNKIPYQNVSQMASAADPSKRRIPSIKHILVSIFNLHGGLCWTLNAGLYLVLKGLGYDTTLCVGSVFHTQDHGSHVVVIVKSLTAPNSHHIAEVGFAAISPKAICLDFEEESETVDNIYVPHKYIKYEGWFVRCHKSKPKSKDFGGVRVVQCDGWDLMCYFNLDEYTYDQAEHLIRSAVYEKPDEFFNNVIYIAVHSDARFIFLYNHKLKIEKSPGGDVEIVIMETDEQLIDVIKQHFFTIPEDEVRAAVRNWRKLTSG